MSSKCREVLLLKEMVDRCAQFMNSVLAAISGPKVFLQLFEYYFKS
jgi:ubiquitin conjugation factor E4 B